MIKKCRRSCHKEYTYESSIFYGFKVMAKDSYCQRTHANAHADTRDLTLATQFYVSVR